MPQLTTPLPLVASLLTATRTPHIIAGVSTSTVPTVQLENGCACCSLSDELATSIQELLDVGEKEGGNSFDRIVIELSGVADPTAVIGNFESLILSNHPLRDKVDLRNPNVVTLVDAGAFGKDWMTWNTAGEREGWVEDGDACSESLLITELLAEQVEAADTLVVNKIDMVSGKEMKDCEEMVRGLNSKARVFTSEFGKAPVIELLRSKGEEGEVGGGCQDKSCGDPKCETHGDVVKEDAGGCNDPGCGDPNCKTHGEGAGHDHGHSHDHEEVESKDKPQMAGITSFTYKASRPFHMDKLLGVLNTWPVPVKDTLDLDLMATYRDQKAKMPDGKEVSNPFVSILRSKGFCWLAPQEWNGANGDAWRHDTAMYWSHASKHFGINQAGKWWGTLESKDKVREFLKGREKEAERIFREDWVGEEFGDRRQELVFIGVNYDEEDITKALDDCLFTEDEMDVYRAGVATVMDV